MEIYKNWFFIRFSAVRIFHENGSKTEGCAYPYLGQSQNSTRNDATIFLHFNNDMQMPVYFIAGVHLQCNWGINFQEWFKVNYFAIIDLWVEKRLTISNFMCSFLLRILKQFKGDPLLETRVSALFLLLKKKYKFNIEVNNYG